jgi:hypothetical protein
VLPSCRWIAGLLVVAAAAAGWPAFWPAAAPPPRHPANLAAAHPAAPRPLPCARACLPAGSRGRRGQARRLHALGGAARGRQGAGAAGGGAPRRPPRRRGGPQKGAQAGRAPGGAAGARVPRGRRCQWGLAPPAAHAQGRHVRRGGGAAADIRAGGRLDGGSGVGGARQPAWGAASLAAAAWWQHAGWTSALAAPALCWQLWR